MFLSINRGKNHISTSSRPALFSYNNYLELTYDLQFDYIALSIHCLITADYMIFDL